MNRQVYVDNAATTKISSKVLEKMLPYLKENYGNPSSLYSLGAKAKHAIEDAREDIANCFCAKPQEIYFTCGGSEADNWAIKGYAEKIIDKDKNKNHIITSAFEHHAVLHTVQALQKKGFDITYLPVYENGIVKPEDLEKAINERTALVSIMFANNEIGTLQPIKELADICKKHNVVFHTDAVQAVGNVKIDVNELGIDMMSISAHKIHGPKGCGALYLRKGIALNNLLDGGAQENGKRAGTENTAAIVGFAEAVKLATKDIDKKVKYITELRDYFIENALKIDRSLLNGSKAKRLAGNINMCFEGIEGESLLLSLDLCGISASSGSACTSGSLDPSHVLLAVGLPHEIAHGSLRISLSEENTKEDVDYILQNLTPIIQRLRNMSPLWEKIIKENRQAFRKNQIVD